MMGIGLSVSILKHQNMGRKAGDCLPNNFSRGKWVCLKMGTPPKWTCLEKNDDQRVDLSVRIPSLQRNPGFQIETLN